MAYSTGTLAQGCFGKVYKEKYNDTWAAIKKVPHHLISRKDLERECEVYNKANHPNIVKLLGNITLKDRKWIIPLEFIFGEDLETTIFKASKSKIQLTPSNKGTIIIGMCEGLLHLHSKDIVHQDLKPENIMVEHNTNRAVIIDLGLAKFFRHGLNSAMDMGNEAYSAPEVLQRGSQRDQRSDVWAMGKIIAELCARIRLYTPSVCPTKIKETLKDQPYCQAVCRMVETNPSLRASMGGIISEIRMAGGAGIVTNTAIQRELLRPPSPQVNARNRSPSPMNRGASPMRRDPSPMNRAPSPFNRDPLPVNRAPSPFNRDPSPLNRAPSPFNRDPSPLNRSPSPLKWERSPKPALHLSPSPQRIEDKNKNQALVPTGGANVTQDFMKLRLYQEAAKDLPCNLPTTGRVVVRRFEEKNGEVETWEQKEVVTRDGKIVKFDDVKFNSKEVNRSDRATPPYKHTTQGLARLSDFSLSGIRPPLADHSHLRVLELFDDSEELCEVLQSPKWRVETHSMHSRENMPTLDEYEGYASTSLTNLDVSEDNRKETFPDDSETLKKPRKLVRDQHLDKYEKLTFTPELVPESENTLYRFRCPGPGVFQCALTGLGFVMGKEAELLYRTVQWDESLLQSAGKIAAGLLFDIKCSQNAAIHQLHLPHCEIMDALPPDGLLSVIHITDDGTSILEPLQITNTHVVVEVPHLSAFGLVMDFLRWVLNRKDTQPVGGQVLLFLGQPNPKTQRQKLHVLLLPRNIHLCEVSKQQRHSVNIWAPSSCKLIKDQSYTLHCPQAIKIQPKRADFDLEFGPNYHPTFEIRLPTDTDEVTLTVRDQRETEVWECDVDLAGDQSISDVRSRQITETGYYPDSRQHTPQRSVPAVNTVPAEEMLFSVWTQFVIRVTNPVLNQLLDKLHEHRVINYEEMQSAKGKERADKARDVIDMAQRKGSEASSVLIDALLELDSWLARALSLR